MSDFYDLVLGDFEESRPLEPHETPASKVIADYRIAGCGGWWPRATHTDLDPPKPETPEGGGQ